MHLLEDYRGTRLKQCTNSWRHRSFSGWREWDGERNREGERPPFVSGLNQRLTEICLDGSKLFSMGNMWPPQEARCFWEASRATLFTSERCVAKRHKVCRGASFCLYYKWPRLGWEVKAIITCVNTSLLPCKTFCLTRLFPAGKCLQCINIYSRGRRVQRRTVLYIYIGPSLSNKEKLRQHNGTQYIFMDSHMQADTHTHTPALINRLASRVCEASPP